MIIETKEDRNLRKQREYSKRWREKHRAQYLELSRIAGRKRWAENKTQEKAKNKINQANRAANGKQHAYNSAYYQKNKERLHAQNKAWREANKEQQQIQRKKSYEEKRAHHLAEKRIYYLKNREKLRAAAKLNRHIHRKNEDIRRARKFNATVGDTKVITAWENRWRLKRRVRCYWCECEFDPKEAHRDHVIPLAKGGEHSLSNLVISCGSCNSRKHARTLEKWNAELAQPALL